MTAIWSTDPTTKVNDARLRPACTSDECSGWGNETIRVRTASIKLIGYALLRPFAMATPVMRYAIHPTKTE
jgi:hypothetical protein